MALVTSVAFSPNGSLLATGTDRSYYFDADGTYQVAEEKGGTLTVANGETFETIVTVNQPQRINELAFSPGSNLLATASIDGSARVFDARSGQERFRVNHEEAVQSVDFSPDGRFLLTASTDTTARLSRVEDGSEVLRVTHTRTAVRAVFSPTGRYFASGSLDGGVRIVETASGREVARIEHEGWIHDIEFSPNGRLIATTAGGESARVQNVGERGQLAEYVVGETVLDLEYSPDGRLLAIADFGGTVRVLDSASFEDVQTFDRDAPIRDIAFSPDGTRLSAAGQDGFLRTFLVDGWDLLLEVDVGRPILSVAYRRDGRIIAIGSREPAVMQEIEGDTGEILTRLEFFDAHNEGVCCVAYSADGSRLAVGSPIGLFRVFDDRDLSKVAVASLRGRVMSITASEQGALFALGSDASHQHMFRPAGDSDTGFVQIFRQSDGHELASFEYGAAIYSVDFDASGAVIASGTSNGVGHMMFGRS